MKKEYLSNAIGAIDDRHIEEAVTYQGKQKTPAWVRWGGLAACLALVTAIAVLMAAQLMPSTPPSNAEIGLVRNYKGNINTSEIALLWPWEYKTVTEKYSCISIDGIDYYASGQTLAAERLGELIGSYEAVGHDYYEENKEYRERFEVFAVQDVPHSAYVAVKAEGEYHIYATNEGRGALTVPEMRYLAGRVTEIGDGYVIIDDTELCTDPEEGMSFKISIDDPRIKRCFEFAGYSIEVGSIVMFSFYAPITLGEGNTVDGAIDVNIGYLAGNGDVLIPE